MAKLAMLWTLSFKISLILQVRVRNTFLFFMIREMSILFSLNCERIFLFSVKRDLDPHFTTLNNYYL